MWNWGVQLLDALLDFSLRHGERGMPPFLSRKEERGRIYGAWRSHVNERVGHREYITWGVPGWLSPIPNRTQDFGQILTNS